ncbi:unnamed protein product [marine sediment metagenome]|uniref:Uncharacterized protein n=1 Tax=marine sediment metagenome TaxID=412755 RepID=X1JEL5_9ZZZZ
MSHLDPNIMVWGVLPALEQGFILPGAGARLAERMKGKGT